MGDSQPNEGSTSAAVAALQAELGHAMGIVDSLDRKAALLPAILAALAGLLIPPGVLTVSQVSLLAAATVVGIAAVACAAVAMHARGLTIGPEAVQVVGGMTLSAAEFNARVARSLAKVVETTTAIGFRKARWVNRAMVLTAGAVLIVLAARFAGGVR